MLINVNFYKETGKWYAEGVVEVEHKLYELEELKQDIIDNQDILVDSWNMHSEFFVVISLFESDDEHAFAERLFHPHEFDGLKPNKARKEPQDVSSELQF